MLTEIADWVTQVIEKLGYLGVAFLVALENVFPPIPSEVVLPFAGFVASDGDAWLPGMVLAATSGSLVGAWVLYGVAAFVGPLRLRRFVERYGRWLSVSVDDLEKAESWFDRHSQLAVLICRCVPLIRSLVSIPAGFRRMPFATFTLYTVIGSAVWNIALVGAGYLLRDSWEDVEPIMGVVQWIVVAAILFALLWFLWRRVIGPRVGAGRRGDSQSSRGA
jgi:membrane protein DedA with SNARE-associated domain